MSDEFALHPVLDVPQSLLLEAAVGLDPLDEIAARHGYTQEQTDQLRKDPSFSIRVARVASELKKDGVTFRMRAAHAAEDLIGVIWREAKASTTALPIKIDALKTLAKLGDMEPKANTQVQTGPGFSITINLPGQSPVQVGKASVETLERDVEDAEVISSITFKQINDELALPAEYEYSE